MTKRLKSWLPLLAWMCLIFAASTDNGSAAHTAGFIVPMLRWLLPHASPTRIDSLHFLIRKAGHITEYAILGILALRAFTPENFRFSGKKRWRVAGLALAVAALYAAGDEFHQRFVPSRGASLDDVLLDTFGAFFGIAALMFTRKRHDKNES